MLLHDLTIENFRSFEKYKLDGLARVNLLVGDNNCGKTSVLEAIHIIISQGKLSCALENLVMREGERKLKINSGKVTHELPNVMSLFGRMHLDSQVKSSKKEFEVTPEDSVSHNKLKCGFYETGSPHRSVQLSLLMSSENAPVQLNSESFVQGKSHRQEQLRIGQTSFSPNEFHKPIRTNVTPQLSAILSTIPPHRFLSMRHFGVQFMAREWDKLWRSKKDKMVVDFLKVVVPEIHDVRFGANANSKNNIFIETSSDRILGSEYGDGIYCLLAVGIAICSSERGYCFVDEIDTGLHYSRLADMWKMVITVARNLDVQVFATTHSLDCIRGLAEAVRNDESFTDEVAVFRIDRRTTDAIRFGGEELEVVVGQEIEVRG